MDRTRLVCLLAVMGGVIAGGGSGSAGEYAPYTYGRWVPVGQGTGHNSEWIAVNPDDGNVVIGSSDAGGLFLTCDGGETWSIVNDGLTGGFPAHSDVPLFANGRPNAAVEWDPVDSNYVYTAFRQHLVRGRLTRGAPGRIAWTALDEFPSNFYGYVLDIAMDSDPGRTPNDTARYFYLIDPNGFILFTNDGGQNLYSVARVPFSDKIDPNHYFRGSDFRVFAGHQNPLLATYPVMPNHSNRIIVVPCPTGSWYAYAFHNQTVSSDTTSDPNSFWTWPDPNNTALGLDPNVGANGIILINMGSTVGGILSCDNSQMNMGGIYTKDNMLDSSTPWILRSRSANGHFDTSITYSPSSMVVNPTDSNVCFLVTPRYGAGSDDGGVLRALGLWSADPNYADLAHEAFRELIDPCDSNSVELGYSRYPDTTDAWAVDLCKADPNILYFTTDHAGSVLRSTNNGSYWKVMDTKAKDANDPNNELWSNRGLMNFHASCIVFNPKDPNVYYVGENDSLGAWKTEDRGKTFRRILNFGWPAEDCSPSHLTYSAGGRTYTQSTAWFSNLDRRWADPPNDPNATVNKFWVGGTVANFRAGVVHPDDPNKAWFITFQRTSHCSLVLKTADAGSGFTITMPVEAYFPWEPDDPNYNWDPNDPTTYPMAKVRKQYLDLDSDANCTKLYMAAGKEGILVSSSTDPNTLGDTWSTSLHPNYLDPNDWVSNSNDPNLVVFTAVKVSRSDPNIVYCASGDSELTELSCFGRIYKSTDAGQTWTRMMPPTDPNYPSRVRKLAVHPSDPNVVYAASYYGLSDNNPTKGMYGIWKSSNGGTTWAQVFPEAGGYQKAFCENVCIDSKDPNAVYCTADTKSMATDEIPRPGIYVSRDAGATWQMLDDWSRDDPADANYALSRVVDTFYSIACHPLTGDLYVGTPAGAYWWPRDRALTVRHYPDEDPNDLSIETGVEYGTLYVDGSAVDANNLPYPYPEGTQVTLNAVPVSGKKFFAWFDGHGNLLDVPNPCDPQVTVMLHTDRTIWAGFYTNCGSGMGMFAVPWLGMSGLCVLLLGWSYRRRR